MSKTTIREQLERYGPELIGLRRHLHENPELSHDETQTAAHVTRVLEKAEMTVRQGIAKTGLLVEIGNGSSKKTIGIRCDMDALPIREETGQSYASRKAGVMHACGHDVHTAIVTGTALVLNRLKDQISGRIKFIFQPAEEALEGGADLVVKEGVVDDVQALFGIHVDPSIPYGKFGLKNGAMMASVDFIDLTIRGQGGHGARPHQTVDPVFVASQVLNSLYQINGRYFSPLENPTVLSFGEMKAGETYNVIAETCSIKGTFRTFDDADRKKYRFMIENIARKTAAMFGAECTVTITPNAPPVINDERLGSIVEGAVSEAFGRERILHLKYPMMASEDFAYYREKCPIYFLRLGTQSSEATAFPLHHPKFDVDERIIADSVELLCHVLLRSLQT